MENDCLQSALDLAERHKFCVFPLYGIKENHTPAGIILSCSCGSVTCLKNAGKHPAITRGRNAASYDPRVIENLWAARVGLNLGIATGAESGVFVVDVDGIIGEENLEKLLQKHGRLPKTLVSITGRGKHIFFKYPDRKVFNRTNVLGEKVDVRGDGGYVVGPNSKHISGVRYKWEDPLATIANAPKWLLDIVCEEHKAPVVRHELLEATHDNVKFTEVDVRDMISYISADCDRDTWLRVGMALQQGGYSFTVWDDWSRTAPHRYIGDTAQQWKSFKPDGGITMGTLVNLAKMNGWKHKDFFQEHVSIDNHPARDFLLAISKNQKPEPSGFITNETGMIPEEVMRSLPGVIGDTVRWITDVAVKPQPELALLNVLATLGALFGRRYAMRNLNTRTNLYVVGLAPTGKGKELSRQKIKEIMNACDYGSFVGSDSVRSSAGLITSLSKQISQVMMIDEFGDFIDGVIDPAAPSHKAEISFQFTRLYSASSTTYKEGSYADSKQNTPELNCPNLCIYGTTTEDMYAKSMRKIAIKSGSLNRFIVVKGRQKPVLNFDVKDRDIPDDLIEQWRQLTSVKIGGDLSMLNNNEVTPAVTDVNTDDGVDQRLKDIFIMEDNLGDDKAYGPLWVRYRENTIKVAMIFAIARNPVSPIITMKDMDFAEAIVKTSVDYMVYLAKEMMYENAHEKNSKEIYTTIKMRGIAGISKTDITRLYRGLKRKELDDIISQLIDSDYVEAFRLTESTKPVVLYRAVTRKQEDSRASIV